MKGIDRRCGLSSRQSLTVSAFQKLADFASQVFVLKEKNHWNCLFFYCGVYGKYLISKRGA